MKIVPYQSYDGEQAGDSANDKTAIHQVEVFHVTILFQHDLKGRTIKTQNINKQTTHNMNILLIKQLTPGAMLRL